MNIEWSGLRVRREQSRDGNGGRKFIPAEGRGGGLQHQAPSPFLQKLEKFNFDERSKDLIVRRRINVRSSHGVVALRLYRVQSPLPPA